jgi:hypothetical protein
MRTNPRRMRLTPLDMRTIVSFRTPAECIQLSPRLAQSEHRPVSNRNTTDLSWLKPSDVDCSRHVPHSSSS